MRPALEILPASQLAFWEEKKNIPENFVLYGGTAIALRLAHRQSIDFDFFSTAPFQVAELLPRLEFAREAEILQSEPNTLTLRIDRGGPVTISFFGNLSFGQLAAPEIAQPTEIKIASLQDLMATKLRTVFQRSESKDYIDIERLLRADVSLANGLAGAVALFGPTFNPALPLKALTYYDDGDLRLVPLDVRECLLAAVRATEVLPVVTRQSSVIGTLE